MGVILAIALIFLVLVLISKNKSKRKINEAKESDDKIKRQIELDILRKEAEEKGIDLAKYDALLKKDGDGSGDAARKYID